MGQQGMGQQGMGQQGMGQQGMGQQGMGQQGEKKKEEEAIWWEWGTARVRSTSDVLKKYDDGTPDTDGSELLKWNWHVWVEDADGRIYDEIPETVVSFVCTIRGKTVTAKETGRHLFSFFFSFFLCFFL